MNNKNIIIAGVIAAGLYLFSQTKKIPFFTEAQKTARRSPQATTPTTRQRTAQKVAQKVAQKKVAPKRIGQPTTQAARIAAARRAAAQRAAAQRAAARRAAAQRAAAQKAAQKKVAPWKAPYKFPKLKFRVITPSDKLRNLVKKDITRKKAVQQKKVQKTTPGTPSDRRKSRLEALYGSHWRSHWHDIWVQRQK